MTKLSPLVVVLLVLLVFGKTASLAQNCDGPQQLCSQGAAQSSATENGTPVTAPNTFCTTNFDNAIFFQFSTLDQLSFPGISYDDPTAVVDISGINCNADTLFSQSVDVAIFTASDICDALSFETPIACEQGLATNLSIPLDNLAPSTTYYVMISGTEPTAPQINAGECDVNVDVSGGAVNYELQPGSHPEGEENRTTIFDGETVILTADNAFSDLTWTGTALNQTSGPVVSANPEGVGQSFQYTVTTEIDNCVYSESTEVTIFPAVEPFNAFTPNSDGINDTWVIRNIHEWPNAQIIVYSRWGQKVFQTTNYSNDWNGDDLPSATYYYVIELNPIDFNVDPYQGSVTIMR